MPPKRQAAAAPATPPPTGRKSASASPRGSQQEPSIVPSSKKSTSARKAGATGKRSDPAIDEPLFEALCSGAALEPFIDQLNALFEDDAHAVVATLVSLVSRAAGFAMSFSGDQFADASTITTFIDELLTRAPAEVATYPLIDKDAKYRKLQRGFPLFFQQLFQAFHTAGRLTDNDGALELLVPWLAALAECKARYFRYSASLALFSGVRKLSSLLTSTQHAISVAKSKRDAQALTKTQEVLNQRHHELFAISLHNRVKDVAAEIRLLAFDHLREVLLENPGTYVQNKFVRYLSIALYDKRTDIRAIGADILARLLSQHPEHAPKIREFLKHFAGRLAEMSADADGHVAELAIKIAALILKLDKDSGEMQILTDDLLDRVMVSLLDDRHGIRAAAGTFLKLFLRCRVGGSDDAETSRLRAEAVCTLAHSILEQQGTPAERYIVDALWVDHTPYALLTDYQLYFALATAEHGAPADAASALRFIAALAERLRVGTPLAFGPPAKDDYKATNEAPPKAAARAGAPAPVDAVALRERISRDFAQQAFDIIDHHHEAPEVVAAVAQLLKEVDLKVFPAHKMAARFKGILAALKRAALSDDFPPHLSCAVEAAFVFLYGAEGFAYHAEVENELAEIAKAAVRGASGGNATGKGRKSSSQSAAQGALSASSVAAWRRVAWVSGVVSLTDSFPFLLTALQQDWAAALDGGVESANHALSVLDSACQAAVNMVFWGVVDGTANPAASSATAAKHIKALLSSFLTAFDVLIRNDSAESCKVALRILCAMNDFVALPFYDVSDDEQDSLSSAFRDGVTKAGQHLAQVLEAIKGECRPDAVLPLDSRDVFALRRDATDWDALVIRLCTGFVRLVAFDRFRRELVPLALSFWTRVTVKGGADLFKGLFYASRHNATTKLRSSPATLEIETLLAALKQCHSDHDTAGAQEQLLQVGSKLASMHFLATDKHYDVVISVVRHALQHANDTQDTLILLAAMPYCSKLRPPDAIGLVSAMGKLPLFDGSVHTDAATSAALRGFVSALRRAAKLESGDASGASIARSGMTPAPGGASERRRPGLAQSVAALGSAGGTTDRKRQRNDRGAEDDELMAEITQRRQKAASNTKQPQLVTSRVENADGWRSRNREDSLPTSAALGGRGAASAVAVASQRSAGGGASTQLSGLMGDDEVFISTQEWN